MLEFELVNIPNQELSLNFFGAALTKSTPQSSQRMQFKVNMYWFNGKALFYSS